MTSTDERWLVTINGRVASARMMDDLGQHRLATYLDSYSVPGNDGRGSSEFISPPVAYDFRDLATSEFPEDDVRLWVSVDRP